MACGSRFGLASLIALAFAVTPGAGIGTEPQPRFVTVGTSYSLYYDIGRALCSVVDQTRGEHGIRCSAETTPGPVYNLEHLLPWDLDFALVQSDTLHDAYLGEGIWQGRPNVRLRSVMALYPEVLTLIAPADSTIRSVDDLAGKRFNIGPPGSGLRATWEHLQGDLDWAPDSLNRTVEMRADQAAKSLCSGGLDAGLMMVGHPSPIITAALAQCRLWLVPVQGPAVEGVIAQYPYYAVSSIAASTYGLTGDVPTFGARAVLVTSADTPASVVHGLTKALLDDLSALRTSHPALGSLDPSQMTVDGLGAPLHPGAARAFREHGIDSGTAPGDQ